MLERGWRLDSNGDYRPELGVDTAQLFEFIGATQAEEWAELKSSYGNDPDAAQRGFARR
jgi:type I restriction enzyme R subunit